jgi:hypothetical protein
MKDGARPQNDRDKVCVGRAWKRGGIRYANKNERLGHYHASLGAEAADRPDEEFLEGLRLANGSCSAIEKERDKRKRATQ